MFPEKKKSLAHKMKKKRFLVIFKIYQNINLEKYAIHTSVSETFYKNYHILKLK